MAKETDPISYDSDSEPKLQIATVVSEASNEYYTTVGNASYDTQSLSDNSIKGASDRNVMKKLKSQSNKSNLKKYVKRQLDDDDESNWKMGVRRSMDECDLYGQLLAKKLRKLDEHIRDVAMHDIDNIMFRAKMQSGHSQKYNPPSPTRRQMKSPIFIVTQNNNTAQYEDENTSYQEQMQN